MVVRLVRCSDAIVRTQMRWPAVLLLLGCSESVVGLEGTLVLPEVVDFGEVPVGTESLLRPEIRNGTRSWVDFSNARAELPFAVIQFPRRAAPGAAVSFAVSFLPASQGELSGTLDFEAEGRPVSIALTGRGVEKTYPLAIEPATIDFGEVLIGDSAESEVRLT